MFGNKKTTLPNDDDIQLTTHSMKNDLEGNSEKESVLDQKPIIPQKPDSASQKPEINDSQETTRSFSPRKETLFDTNKKSFSEIKKEVTLPTDLPVANKMPENFPVVNSLKKQTENSEEKTHADSFFPEDGIAEKETKKSFHPFKKEPSSLSSGNQNLPAKKDYDEFFKGKIKESLPEEEKSGSSSSLITIIVLIVLAIAVASGAYYYFFVINKTTTPATEQIDPTPSFPVEPEPIVEPIQPPAERNLPVALINAKEIILTTDKNIKATLFNAQNPDKLASGFYKIKNEEGAITVEKFSTLLDLTLPTIIDKTSQNVWIYYKTSKSPEIGLIFEVNQNNSLEIIESIQATENTLPLMLSNLYSPSIKESLKGTIAFKDSLDNPGFRYYNIGTVSSNSKSLDWGMTSDNKILVFATSREMAKEIAASLLVNY